MSSVLIVAKFIVFELKQELNQNSILVLIVAKCIVNPDVAPVSPFCK